LGGEWSISASRADAEDANLVGVNVLAADQVGDGAFDVFDALGRVFEVSRLAFGFTLVCGVVGEAGEAGLGEHAGIVGWRLLLDGGPWVAYNYGSARTIRGVGSWVVDVGGKFHVMGEERDILG
jgi:hypothetical protein